MVLQIYKEDVIEALATEPLNIEALEGRFFTPPMEREGRSCAAPIGKCTVCAVGAVIRAVYPHDLPVAGNLISLANRLTSAGQVHYYDMEEVLDDQDPHYLSALSVYYESFRGTGVPVEEVRRHCIDFVEEYFPEGELICELPGEE